MRFGVTSRKEFLTDIILPGALWTWDRLGLEQNEYVWWEGLWGGGGESG